jgi:ATP-dependent DNA helicase 2 subunit 2
LGALVVATQMISDVTTGKTGNPLRFERRIIMVTDGHGPIDSEDLDLIVSKMKDDGIELTLLYASFARQTLQCTEAYII